jgi:hypothetical protein
LIVQAGGPLRIARVLSVFGRLNSQNISPEMPRKDNSRMPHFTFVTRTMFLVGMIAFAWMRAGHAEMVASDWEVNKADNSQVSFEGQRVVIRARENSFASISQAVTIDSPCRVTCEIIPTYSRRSANGILLFWDLKNWIRFAVVRLDVSDSEQGGWFANNGGGYYLVNRMTEGKYSEEMLGTCYGYQPHRLALELADDGLRFMIMANLEKWISYRTEYLPPGLRNRRLQKVFLGKTAIDPKDPDKSAGMRFATGPGDGGAEVVSELSNFSIQETAAERRQLSGLERKELDQPGIDYLGQMEVSGPRDPTFASVSQHFPGMKFYREAIGIKDHPQDIGVGFDGSLEFNDRDVSSYWMDPALDTGYFTANLKRLGRDIKVSGRYLLDGNWPAVVCEFSSPGVKYKQTVFGYAHDFSITNDVYAICALEIVNETKEEKSIALAYSVATDRLRWDVKLPASSSRTVYLKTPFDRVEHKAAKLNRQEYQKTLGMVREYWRDLYKDSFTLEVPEKRVNDAFKAWLGYTFINTDKRGDRYFICDGTGFYNEIYGYSACIYIRALLRLGYFKDARTYLVNQLRFVREDGLFLLNFGATDTGSYLRAFADYYRYTHDRTTIEEVKPQIKKMAGWVIEQRASSNTDSPITSGLIHVRPYADHPEATYAYLTDVYLCKGLEEAAFLLSEIQDSAASKIGEEAQAYRKDISRSMDHAILEKDGIKLLPIMPEADGQFKHSNSRADDYYGCNCSMLMEIGFLDPKGRYADLLANVLEQRGGKSLGCLAWRHGIDHAYLYGYLLNCLQRNRPREAVLGLYGWMAYGMTRNTYAGTEVTYHRLGDNCATLPHTFSSTEQMRLLMDMLVRTEGSDLYLAQAVPDAWLEPGKTVRLQNAPTPFGRVSYRIKSSSSKAIAEISLGEGTRPETLYFGLRPPGKWIRSVTVNRRPAAIENGLVAITHPERKNRVEVRWE